MSGAMNARAVANISSASAMWSEETAVTISSSRLGGRALASALEGGGSDVGNTSGRAEGQTSVVVGTHRLAESGPTPTAAQRVRLSALESQFFGSDSGRRGAATRRARGATSLRGRIRMTSTYGHRSIGWDPKAPDDSRSCAPRAVATNTRPESPLGSRWASSASSNASIRPAASSPGSASPTRTSKPAERVRSQHVMLTSRAPTAHRKAIPERWSPAPSRRGGDAPPTRSSAGSTTSGVETTNRTPESVASSKSPRSESALRSLTR
eukprot:Amastigsp_a178004_8.p2 type:complete len:267 gc:universal Amastigsp_a178004_8:599-1399(+)